MSAAMDPELVGMLKPLFENVDTDKSGALDSNEIYALFENLGITASRKQVLKIIRDVDPNGDDQIDFDEFCTIIGNNSSGTSKGANGISFAGIIDRMKNSGPPMVWRSDKLGKGLSIDANSITGTAGKDEYGVALMTFLPKDGGEKPDGAWLSIKQWTEATCLLEVEKMGGDAFIGIAGSNFKARTEDGQWDIPLGKSADQPGMAPWVAVQLMTGDVYKKGKVDPGIKLGSPGKGAKEGDRIAFEINMHLQTLSITCLRLQTSADDDAAPDWKEEMKIELDNLPPELCVAVSLGNNADAAAKPTTLRVVGSWCQKTAKAVVEQDAAGYGTQSGVTDKAQAAMIAASQASGA